MKIFLIVALILSVIIPVGAQEMSKQEMEMMKKWKAYSTPGEHHEFLKKLTGKWSAHTKMWMKPGAPPMEQKQDMEAKMMFGGRYYFYKMKGNYMNMPFEGMNITAFDNMKKKYISIWIDNMGTGIYQTEGTLDKTGKIKTETGIWDDVMTGGKVKVRIITTIVSPDKHIMKMYSKGGMHGPKEFQNMEVVYTKKK